MSTVTENKCPFCLRESFLGVFEGLTQRVRRKLRQGRSVDPLDRVEGGQPPAGAATKSSRENRYSKRGEKGRGSCVEGGDLQCPNNRVFVRHYRG